jgi:hypothetical protein
VKKRRTAIQNRNSRVFFLALLLAGTLTLASLAPAQETSLSPPGSQDQEQSQQNGSSPGSTQTKEQENIQHERRTGTSKDRILWTLPNFLTVENAGQVPPLTSGQKFNVVGRSLIDPSEFVLIGLVAGLGQASNSDPSYGQGAQGYAKRYGTAYGDNAIENFMSSAVLPSVLHQDPRYYQLGRGGFLRRTGHAIGRVLISRSDSGQTQFNYSEMFGAGIAATISTYTYHPRSERSLGNVADVWATQMGWDAATYMMKEFWPDLRKHHENPRN